MMYSEFVEGTGCKQNEHNYKVFIDLEVMYMNSDLTKEQIYEYGKKLVDNSKSEAELQFEADIKEKIAEIKKDIEWYKGRVDIYKTFTDYDDPDGYWKRELKATKSILANYRAELRRYKDILAFTA